MPRQAIPEQCICCDTVGPVLWTKKVVGASEYLIWKCASCQSGFVWPRPGVANLAALYLDSAADILTHAGADYRYYPTSFREAEVVLKRSAGLCEGRRLLDVGAGRGTYSRAAALQGFEVDAIEPDETARQSFKKLNGFVPYGGFLMEFAERCQKRYDVVLLSNVLEHMPQPNSTVRRLHDLTVFGGLTVIAVPHFGSLLSRLQGRNDMFVSPPEHLNFFSKEGLISLFARNGYRLIHIDTASKLPRHRIKRLLGSKIVTDFVCRGFRVGILPIDLLKMGMTINAYFRKMPYDELKSKGNIGSASAPSSRAHAPTAWLERE